jgi:ubiquinone/menaquinone biosynthesis C-methylase UbiE
MNYYCIKCQKPFLTISENHLSCGSHQIPVVKSIPRFVNDSGYASSFGSQWNLFRTTQLDSVSGLSISRERLERCIYPITSAELEGKKVLEIGCGAGRFTEILLASGADVVSVDLSNAVDANRENFPISRRHAIAQADASSLPFADETFDLSICLGVLQHTADPNAVAHSMYRVTKNGGYIVFDHYRATLSFLTRMLPLYRFALKIMAIKDSVQFTARLVQVFFPIHKNLGRHRVGYALLSRISPIVTYFHSYPSLTLEQQREWSILDTHDSLFDFHKRLHSRKTLNRWLKRLRLNPSRIVIGGIGLEVVIKK